MFEEKTFKNILKNMLDRVPDSIDKREGSIIYDAIAPAAAEITQLYINLELILKETFADTASRNYLIRRAAERGITPYSATNAVGKGVFNMPVPIGARFNLGKLNYRVKELISEKEHSYKMECETEGREVNSETGTLTPIEYITGLETAELTEILIPGEDVEGTEEFRKRYISSFNNIAYGGNREDYIQRVTAIAGVGGVKVYRAWNGGGTVKLVIVDSEFNSPTEELVAEVQRIMDPSPGDGIGVAPIDHVVTVFGAAEQAINIETSITYADGWSFEDAKMYIEEAIDKYISELRGKWQETERIIVRVSQIESRLLEIEGIVDIGETKINGVGGNFTADEASIVKRGSIVG